MKMETGYYNYYNKPYRYTPDKPSESVWRTECEITDDKIKAKNGDPDSDKYKDFLKIEEAYYAVSVANRAKYKTDEEASVAIQKKYYKRGDDFSGIISDKYAGYSREEVKAMHDNELSMTLYGSVAGDRRDPHCSGRLIDTPSAEKQGYNRKMVNLQFNNIFKNAGLGNILDKYNMNFTIEPLNFTLKVSGIDDENIVKRIEELLNKDNNSRELFYHLMNSNASISRDTLEKYRLMRTFKSVTDGDIRDFKQIGSGLFNEKGENILDVFKEGLKTTNTIPSAYKGDAYSDFKDKLDKMLKGNFVSVPDLNLSVGYSDGSLQDLKNESIMVSRFSATV